MQDCTLIMDDVDVIFLGKDKGDDGHPFMNPVKHVTYVSKANLRRSRRLVNFYAWFRVVVSSLGCERIGNCRIWGITGLAICPLIVVYGILFIRKSIPVSFHVWFLGNVQAGGLGDAPFSKHGDVVTVEAL